MQAGNREKSEKEAKILSFRPGMTARAVSADKKTAGPIPRRRKTIR